MIEISIIAKLRIIMPTTSSCYFVWCVIHWKI